MKNFTWIEQYLNGQMGEEDRLNFEQEIASNPKLAEEVKIQRFEEMAISWQFRQNLQKQIQQHRLKEQQAEPKKPGLKVTWRRSSWIISIAALMVLFLGLWFLWPSGPTYIPQLAMELSAKQDPSAGLSSTLKSGDVQPTTLDSLYLMGHNYFQEGAYQQAVDVFESYLEGEENRNRDYVEYYLFLTYCQLQNQEKADSLLQAILSNNKHRFKPFLEKELK